VASALGRFFKRFRTGDPIRKACDSRNLNTVFDVLEDLQGLGCRIERTNTGKGWMIVVDGTSDIEPPEDYTPPWEPDKSGSQGAQSESDWESGDGSAGVLEINPGDRIEILVDNNGNVVGWTRTTDGSDPEHPAQQPPPCGHPLNLDDDYHPLDETGGAGGSDDDDTHPLEEEGDGGFTPLCGKE